MFLARTASTPRSITLLISVSSFLFFSSVTMVFSCVPVNACDQAILEESAPILSLFLSHPLRENPILTAKPEHFCTHARTAADESLNRESCHPASQARL